MIYLKFEKEKKNHIEFISRTIIVIIIIIIIIMIV